MQQLDVSREIALLKAKTDEERADINKSFDVQKGRHRGQIFAAAIGDFSTTQDLAQSNLIY